MPLIKRQDIHSPTGKLRDVGPCQDGHDGHDGPEYNESHDGLRLILMRASQRCF